jgi:uncharacterized protein YlxW (UPF0749 family)
MKDLRTQVLLGIICLLIGVMVVTQYRSQRQARPDVPESGSDQATYISQLVASTKELQAQADTLDRELRQYESSDSSGKSNLDAMVKDVQNLRMANGEVEVTGPGITVMVEGDLTVLDLQDLVNELRNASAEAVAVNGIRVVTRSAIVADENGRITVDRQPVTSPYRLEAIGEPDTLSSALERKGGLIALLEARDSALRIKVLKYEIWDRAGWLRLPKTAIDFSWSFAQPAP